MSGQIGTIEMAGSKTGIKTMRLAGGKLMLTATLTGPMEFPARLTVRGQDGSLITSVDKFEVTHIVTEKPIRRVDPGAHLEMTFWIDMDEAVITQPRQDECEHPEPEPVESGGVVVARLCLTCDTQLEP